ncbi:hypothetical protein GQ600_9909 [Phytophthora cactorum]|nr:hypothetical protein GQ600_9909 [Phytophthora cactorum]
MGYEQQHMQSGERPKLFMQPPSTTATWAPHYYPPPQMGGQMLHVSSDYEYANGAVVTPSSARSGSKRSREDLNLKEKKRMFKLNDRINNSRTFWTRLVCRLRRTNSPFWTTRRTTSRCCVAICSLPSRRPSAPRNRLRPSAHRHKSRPQGGQGRPRRVPEDHDASCGRGMNMQTVTFNSAFVKHTGQTEPVLKKQKTLRPYLCVDQEKLDSIMKRVRETKQSTSALVKTSTAGDNAVSVNLVAAVVTDESGKPTNVEFSLIPVEMPQQSHSDSMMTRLRRPRTSR